MWPDFRAGPIASSEFANAESSRFVKRRYIFYIVGNDNPVCKKEKKKKKKKEGTDLLEIKNKYHFLMELGFSKPTSGLICQ